MKKNITGSMLLVLALAGSGAIAAQPGAGKQPMPLALMKRPATPAVLALFTAASEGDEAAFGRLIGTVGNVNDYVVGENKLLHALLRPAASLEAEERARRQSNTSGERTEARWLAQRARHMALLPAKTRMLAVALQHGAAVNDGDRASNAAALHLAATFGTAEMVRMLLAHGADPKEVGGAFEDHTPFEYALAPDVSRTSLTELITPQERSAILVLLLRANPERPYLRHDKAGEDGTPSADYLWNNLLQMTRGTAILDALERTGTRPYVKDNGKSPYGYAAEAGNIEALGWLKTRVPRVDKDGQDRWLDAAIWALYLPQPDADAALDQLLVRGMPWAQPGPASSERLDRYTPFLGRHDLDLPDAPVLVHAVYTGHADWVRRLVALGAPLGPGGERELAAAVQQGDVAMVALLLGLGADPLAASQPGASTALDLALYVMDERHRARWGSLPAQAPVLLPLLLKHIVTVQRHPLATIPGWPLEQAVRAADKPDGAARVRLLLQAGFDATDLSNIAAATALGAPDRALAVELLDRGMLGGKTTDAKEQDGILRAAVAARRADVLPRLLKLGLDPNHHDDKGRSAVDDAVAQGAAAELAILVAAGGRIDATASNGGGMRPALAPDGAGAPAAPVQSAAARVFDQALRKTLPGTYAVASQRELASGIVLRADGTFIYGLTYGNVDEAAEGHWEVRAGAVVFTTPPNKNQPVLLSARAGAVQPGFVTVTLEEGGRSDIDVTLLGDAPVAVAARRDADGWRAAMAGPVRQIVMRNAERGAQVAIDVPPAQAQQRAYRLTVNEAFVPAATFNHSMQVTGGELVFVRDGMALRYRKETPEAPGAQGTQDSAGR